MAVKYREKVMSKPPFKIRVATPADAAAVTAVLASSYGNLLAGHYEAADLDRALPLMGRANPVLLRSGRYYVAEVAAGQIIGCGGWSLERPGTTEVVDGLAHVRHFGTDPLWTRRGVAHAILSKCICDAEAHGVCTMEAYSTSVAVNFYRTLGFLVIDAVKVTLAPGVSLPSVLMRRRTATSGVPS